MLKKKNEFNVSRCFFPCFIYQRSLFASLVEGDTEGFHLRTERLIHVLIVQHKKTGTIVPYFHLNGYAATFEIVRHRQFLQSV